MKIVTKAQRVRDYLTENPTAPMKAVAAKVRCDLGYVYTVKKEMAKEAEALATPGVVDPATAKKLARVFGIKVDTKKTNAPETAPPTSVDDLLNERGSRYGPFLSHAALTQTMKTVVATYLQQRNKILQADQQESIDMIFHKIGRIVNGDPDYVDSWKDIAGYATLVSDRLEGKVR